MRYITFVLSSLHKKQLFDCGKEILNTYFRKQAKQDVKRKISACFVLSDENEVVIGFYTLSNDSIPLEELPKQIKNKLPKAYLTIPITLLGRLAIDSKFKGQGYGELLLIDALRRSYDVSNESIGSIAVVVDPLDLEAIAFYEKYGFILLPNSGKMFISMTTISNLFLP